MTYRFILWKAEIVINDGWFLLNLLNFYLKNYTNLCASCVWSWQLICNFGRCNFAALSEQNTAAIVFILTYWLVHYSQTQIADVRILLSYNQMICNHRYKGHLEMNPKKHKKLTIKKQQRSQKYSPVFIVITKQYQPVYLKQQLTYMDHCDPNTRISWSDPSVE